MGALIPHQDQDNEKLTAGKFNHWSNVLRNGLPGPVLYLDSFSDFEIDAVQDLTGKRVENLTLDVDAFIAPPDGNVLPINLDHIDKLLRKGVRIGINSNNNRGDKARLKPLLDRGIRTYSGRHPKPYPESFLDSCDEFWFDPKTTIHCGDDPGTDGGAAGVLGGVCIVRHIPIDFKYIRGPKRLAVHTFKDFARSMAIEGMLDNTPTIIRSTDIERWRAKKTALASTF